MQKSVNSFAVLPFCRSRYRQSGCLCILRYEFCPCFDAMDSRPRHWIGRFVGHLSGKGTLAIPMPSTIRTSCLMHGQVRSQMKETGKTGSVCHLPFASVFCRPDDTTICRQKRRLPYRFTENSLFSHCAFGRFDSRMSEIGTSAPFSESA